MGLSHDRRRAPDNRGRLVQYAGCSRSGNLKILMPVVIGGVANITKWQSQADSRAVVVAAITAAIAVPIAVWVVAVIATITVITVPVPVMPITILIPVVIAIMAAMTILLSPVVMAGIIMPVMMVIAVMTTAGMVSAPVMAGTRHCVQGQRNAGDKDHDNQCHSV